MDIRRTVNREPNNGKNLENIVLQFVQNGVTGKTKEQEAGTSGESTDHTKGSTVITTPTGERGTLHVQGGQTNYVDSSHWLSILHDIKEVREQLALSSTQEQEDDSFDRIGPQPEADLVFGLQQPLNIIEIIRSLPSRPVCDSLLSQYFNSQYMIIPIVHPLKFQKEYEQFWQDSSKSPTLWIGLLFAILGLATTLRQTTDSSMPIESGANFISSKEFRLRTTQCLVLGHYSTAKAYGLETLVLYLQSNLIGLVDSQINLWFLMGIIIRLAMRMGYHRDSRNHDNISPFEGEMRRRVWVNIYQLDVLMSFQLGLPSMIPTDYCDTEAPRNLNFTDFFPDTAVLPPSRPLSDHTSVLYTIVKGKVMGVFKKIVAHSQSLSPPPLETTIMLDIEMRETYNDIPSNYKMMNVSRSFMDTPSTIMKRCSIELLYLKSIVVLHRRFLNRETSDIKYAKFRRSCLDAAMDILARQADLHQASQPGGQLYNDRWMLSWLSAHDFLVAAMVVCLELSEYMRTVTVPKPADFAKQLEALQTSQMIWTSHTSHNPQSKEARTAARVLDLMIRKVKDDNIGDPFNSTLPREDGPFFESSNLPYAEPVTEMIDGSEDLDWSLLDQYFQNTQGLQDFTSSLGTYSEEQIGELFQTMETDQMA
ncbi:Equisetin cluster transcription factor [Lachnellula hyalina]|uniref:Equisetin cluster transcription factor n=1 Tax=Lachnellula hyalina TaxID=1316788 RepID=A0A8H8R8B8_9HELO|nr:Equisetin cluster transcription factor [Lachnellula hyalina]TVY29882.1 Equisetin cluster transcription factor [Lachnellula hyalina]